ncbi:hypothetical protein DYB28_002434, partial [Aphanomyces astaci]
TAAAVAPVVLVGAAAVAVRPAVIAVGPAVVAVRGAVVAVVTAVVAVIAAVVAITPATSRAALPFTQRLLGAENFDEWFFELTSVILAGEDLTEMATHCAQVETATSMKGLRRAYKVLLNDCKRIRQHQAKAFKKSGYRSAKTENR